MILPRVKSVQRFVGLVALTLLNACGSPAGPSSSTTTGPAVTAEDPTVGLQAVGVLTGSYRDGHLSFSGIKPVPDAPGVATQGFGPFTESLVTFATDPGDGIGTGTCTSTQYCAAVSLTNNTGRIMQNTFVEITSYFGIQPTTEVVSWAGTPFTRSSAYASVFVNSGNVEAADYGSFTPGQTTYRQFKFDVGAATDFYFNATVYATFPRTSVSGSIYQGQATVDACAIAGHTFLTGADDAEVDLALPFAYTLLDSTYDRAVIGTNGYTLLYATGGTPPSQLGDNTTLATPNSPEGFYVFWDDLAYDGADGVCTAITGTQPNRTFIVTWSNAKIASSQPGKTTFSAEKVTYSLTMRELYDTYQFIYNLPSGGVTNLTRGGSATIGYYAVTRGSPSAFVYTYNGPSSLIPTAPANYTDTVQFTQYGLTP